MRDRIVEACIIALLALLLSLLIISPAGAWYNTSFTKRAPITITNSPTNGSFQISLNVSYDADMQADFDDLRFVANNDTFELNYTSEGKVNSNFNLVWVRLAGNASPIYMYYGHATAETHEKTGDMVFDWFDDSSDVNKWSGNTGNFNVQSNSIYHSSGTEAWYSLNQLINLGDNYKSVVEFRLGIDSAGGNYQEFGFGVSPSTASPRQVSTTWHAERTNYANKDYYWGNNLVYGSDTPHYINKVFGVANNGTGFKLFVNGTERDNHQFLQNIKYNYIVVYSYSSVVNLNNFDWGRIRKYQEPFPYFTKGAEESQAIPPVCNWSVDVTSGDAPLTVHFTDTSGFNISAHWWNMGDGFIDLNASPTHIYESGGIYTINHTVTNISGTAAFNRSNYITVTARPSASWTSDTNFGQAPLTVQFTSTGAAYNATHFWDFGDGNTSTTVSPLKVYEFVGLFTVKHLVSNISGASSMNVSNAINVTASAPPPTPTPTPTPTLPPSTGNNITASITEDSILWQWSGTGTYSILVDNTQYPSYNFTSFLLAGIKPNSWHMITVANGTFSERNAATTSQTLWTSIFFISFIIAIAFLIISIKIYITAYLSIAPIAIALIEGLTTGVWNGLGAFFTIILLIIAAFRIGNINDKMGK